VGGEQFELTVGDGAETGKPQEASVPPHEFRHFFVDPRQALER
jgi:hypothetical protein